MNLRAYAKINIGLHILGKRSDGFHNIETVFREINLYDDLRLEPADDIALTASSSLVPTDSTNLCVRAAESMRAHTGKRHGVHIALTKRIPIGAGLGGGSSDAATVLVALNALWKVELNRRELETIAATLGSDVPFFLHGGTALGTSKGEVLRFFEMNLPYWIATVTPPVQVSTAWAYSHVRLHQQHPMEDLQTSAQKGMLNPVLLSKTITNDFEETVFQEYPEIQTIKEQLMKAGSIFALMSGSGSSVFGLFTDEQKARTAIQSFSSQSETSLTPPNFNPVREL